MTSADAAVTARARPRPAAPATPLAGVPAVVSVAARQIVTRYAIRPEEPVLQGHYPNFPIFPGVCLVEVALASAHELAAAGGLRGRVTRIDSVRFVGPTYPGDELVTTVTTESGDGSWRCTARVETRHGRAMNARFRLSVKAR